MWTGLKKNKKTFFIFFNLKIPRSEDLTWHTLTCGLLQKRKLVWYVVLARCLHTVRENVAHPGSRWANAPRLSERRWCPRQPLNPLDSLSVKQLQRLRFDWHFRDGLIVLVGKNFKGPAKGNLSRPSSFFFQVQEEHQGPVYRPSHHVHQNPADPLQTTHQVGLQTVVLTDAVCRIHTVTPAERQQSECAAHIIPLPATSLPYLLFFQRSIAALFVLTAT